MFLALEQSVDHNIKYFLIGIEKTATKAVDTLSRVIKLKDHLESQINSEFGRRSNTALVLLNALFQNPVTTIDNAAKICSLSFKAANDLVRLMQEKHILEEMTGQSRNRIFILKPYMEVFSN